jgi:hypothetical protein
LEEQEHNHGSRKLIAAISFYDLGQRKPSSRELVEMAKRFNYEAGAAFLARLNVCLSLAMASSDDKVVLQEIVSAFGDKLYQMWRVYRGDFYDHSLAWRGNPSDRAIISAKPIGGDKLLWDEVIAFKEFPSAREAHNACRTIADRGFPKQPTSADWFECHVVNEFGAPIEEPE